MVFMRQRRAKEGHNAIAHDLVHRACVPSTAAIMRSNTGSRSCRTSSGSRSARSSIEPLRSANNTVTCFRSPSSALQQSASQPERLGAPGALSMDRETSMLYGGAPPYRSADAPPIQTRQNLMKHSTNGILVTHTGSLPRPPALLGLMLAKERGDTVAPDVLDAAVRQAI